MISLKSCLCIGGCADGEIRTGDAYARSGLVVVGRQKISLQNYGGLRNEEFSLTESRYYYYYYGSLLVANGEEELGVWVDSSLTANEALARLLNGYARAVRVSETDIKALLSKLLPLGHASLLDIEKKEDEK